MGKESYPWADGRCRLAVGLSLVVLSVYLPVEARAVPAGTNGLISFISTDPGDPIPRYVNVMSGDGSGARRVTPDRTEKHVTGLSPDGTQVVFTCTCGGVFDIYVMKLDGQGRRNVIPGRYGGNFPTFSPDGAQIAFDNRARTGDFEIYVMDADGRHVINLSDDPTTADFRAKWSPDGQRIAFARGTDNPAARADQVHSDIYVMNSDGTGVQRLTSGIAGAGEPDWSPDGESIVFVNNLCPCGQSDIFVMNADGSNIRQITSNPDESVFPSWSPDGTRIVFQQWAPGSFFADIFTMRPDGTDVVNLTRTPNIGEGGADWGPMS